MITEENLKSQGYRLHKDYLNSSDGLYQKWILDSEGKRAFAMNFYMWRTTGLSFSAEARFYKDYLPYLTYENQMGGDGETNFDLKLLLDNKICSVKDVEDWFVKAYVALGCVPDLHNQ